MRNEGRFGRVAHAVGGGLRGLTTLVLAVALTALSFLVLPLMQQVGRPPESDMELRGVGAANLPPPPPSVEEEEPEKDPEEEPPPPDLADDMPPMDLSQLELALNPGGFGEGVGGMEMAARLAVLDRGGDEEDDGDGVFSLADLDQAPRVLVQTPPEYPAELRKRKIEGNAHVLFIVDKDGRVQNPVVQKSTHPGFAQPALQAVRRWRFEPGRRGGKPVPFRMRVPISFMGN